MKFTKMQGAGNDYVYVNCFEETVEDPVGTAIRVSDRHFGIGSDGLVLICPSETADVKMRMFNADGSEGIMCGNAIRCVGKYVYDRKIVTGRQVRVETLGGIKILDLETEGGKAVRATVDMGVPKITSTVPEPIAVDGQEKRFVGIDMGNPHAVYFCGDIDSLDLEKIGPSHENHGRFPGRVNSEFIKVVDRGHICMRVWERGSGETLACGTGATASAVASILMGYTDDQVRVSLRGGDLYITWDRESGHTFMTGPAVEVFCGEIKLS
ncbi:MAG: diaminopimelate epimerase [Hungatella sp.]|nr:diaminopimelate epimerase [Hungatella sp.]